jgi:hypothetical protein
MGELLYFAQAGQDVKRSGENILPKFEDDGLFLRGGVSKRITDNFGGSIATTINNQHYLLESMLFKQGRYHEVTTNMAYESTGIYGLSVRSRLNASGLVLSQTFRKVWSKPDPIELGSELGEGLTNFTSNLGIKTPYGRLNLFARYNKTDRSISKNYGLSWSLPQSGLFLNSPSLNLELSKNDDDNLIYLSASYRFSSGA